MAIRSFNITKISCSAGTSKVAMAIGDSITLGGAQLLGGWRAPLFAANPGLVIKGSLFSVGYHDGYSGFRIDQISPVVIPLVPTFNPSIILLLAGTNDILQGESGAATCTEQVAFATTLKALAGVNNVIVGTVPYIPSNPTEGAAYNAALLAASWPAGIQIVDVSSTVNYPADYSDALHPNTAGYAKMAAAWTPAVAALL